MRRLAAQGQPVLLEDGLIARYEDVANSVVPLTQMRVPKAVIERQIEKWQGWLEARPGYAEHANR